MTQLSQIALTDEETLTEAVDCLAKHIPLNVKGACDSKALFQILLRAAATGDTIEIRLNNYKKSLQATILDTI